MGKLLFATVSATVFFFQLALPPRFTINCFNEELGQLPWVFKKVKMRLICRQFESSILLLTKVLPTAGL